jgi:hypothetical protein
MIGRLAILPLLLVRPMTQRGRSTPIVGLESPRVISAIFVKTVVIWTSHILENHTLIYTQILIRQ